MTCNTSLSREFISSLCFISGFFFFCVLALRNILVTRSFYEVMVPRGLCILQNKTVDKITKDGRFIGVNWTVYYCAWGTAVAQWLSCCARNRKVAGSIPDGVIGIFHWHNPPDRTMFLGSTQPLTEMSTRRISWGKCGRCVRLTTLPPLCAVDMKSENLNFLEPSGPLQACNGTDLPLTLCISYATFVSLCVPGFM